MRWSFWLSTLITKLVMDKKSREAIAINADHSVCSSSNTILTCTSSGRFTGKLKEIANKRDVSYLCYLVVPKPLLVVRNNILFICSCGRSLLVLASTLSWRRVRTRSRRHTHRKCLLCFNVLVMSLCLVLDLLYTWCLSRQTAYIHSKCSLCFHALVNGDVFALGLHIWCSMSEGQL